MDLKEIKELIRLFDKSELNKLKIKDAEFELSMQTGFEGGTVVSTGISPVAAVSKTTTAELVAPEATSPSVISGDTIASPMIGTYYDSPSPEASSFLKVGDTVKKGQTLCILEAMKIMNEFEADFDCKIIKFLVANGDPVEYDMPLFVVEKI